jgi:hypothetical protein
MPALRLNRKVGSFAAPALPRVGGKRLPIAVALAVFTIALVGLTLRADHPGSPDRLSGAAATRSALTDRTIQRYLKRWGYTRTKTIPLDDQQMRVSFFNGPRIVLEAAVAPNGRVPHTLEYEPGYVRAGGRALQTPLALALLSLLFALCVGCVPLRRMQNLDVLALVSFSVSILALNARLFELSVYAGYPPLAYLGVRCLRVALAGRRARAGRKTRPLYEVLTANWSRAQRLRMLAIGALAAAVALVIASVPGGLVGDVGFTSMSGATQLLDGRLPYGNLPAELVHGDTYPLLAYALYIPAALFMPVHDGFDNLDGALIIAAAFALVAALGIYLASTRLAGGGGREEGLRNVIAWLVFPPVLITASSGSNDLAAAACVAGALALMLRAGGSAILISLAGWVKLVPLFLLPCLVARFRSRRLVTAIAGSGAISLGVLVWILLLGGTHGVGQMLDAVSFQTERGSFLSLWTLLEIRPLQLAFQAAVLSLVVCSTFLVFRESSLARDPRRIAALGGAIMIGFQLGANHWTYAYLPWVVPCVMIALLTRPLSADR